MSWWSNFQHMNRLYRGPSACANKFCGFIRIEFCLSAVPFTSFSHHLSLLMFEKQSYDNIKVKDVVITLHLRFYLHVQRSWNPTAWSKNVNKLCTRTTNDACCFSFVYIVGSLIIYLIYSTFWSSFTFIEIDLKPVSFNGRGFVRFNTSGLMEM